MWTSRLSGVPERVTDKVCTVNGKVYSFGVYQDGSGNLADVFVLNAASYRWDRVETPFPDDGRITIALYTVAAYGHCMYLCGGPYNWPSQSVLYRFDTTTTIWSRPQVFGEAPPSSPGNSACVVTHRKYVLGSFDTWRQLRFLDLQTMEWRRISARGRAPTRRSYHSASVIGTRIYVWGGILADPFHAHRFDSSVYYLETTTSTWVCPHVQGVAPVGREGHCAFVYNEELYVFGGYSALMTSYFSDMHKYDPRTSCWVEVRTCGLSPRARSFHGCCIMGERVFVFDGLGPRPNEEHVAEQEVALTDFHVLHLAPTLFNLSLLAVIDARLDTSHLPDTVTAEINAIISG